MTFVKNKQLRFIHFLYKTLVWLTITTVTEEEANPAGPGQLKWSIT